MHSQRACCFRLRLARTSSGYRLCCEPLSPRLAPARAVSPALSLLSLTLSQQLITFSSFEFAADTLRNPYLQVGGNTGARSVSQISSALRLAGADPNRSRSAFRAPSLADLQNSLGRSASARTSAAPSMVSTSGSVNPYATSRRTAKGTAASVLARLEKMGGGGGGALGGSGGARPPYLVAGER